MIQDIYEKEDVIEQGECVLSKEIEVYNAYFGDCIVLKSKDDDSNLLVDFGMHYFSTVSSVYGNRNNLLNTIADDIANRYSNSDISLLITHFHEDHVSGLIHMYKSGKSIYKGIFNNIYIANIWNNPFAVASNLLEEMLLENELRKSGLPRTTASLFDVLEFLSANVCRIKLLKRGDLFEKDKYITLWPNIDDKENHISEIIQSLGLSKEFEGGLVALAEIVCIFVTQVLLDGRSYSENDNENLYVNQRIQDMRIVYNGLFINLYENIIKFEEDDLLSLQKEKLNKLNHKYNIVFQNNNCGDENVLFTGDVEVKQMSEIAKANDIILHKDYKYIKIPHHGTEGHYFDYSKYNPKYVIITNGRVNTKDSDSYKICNGYGTLNAIHLCTNSNHCFNCVASCTTATSVCAYGRKLVYSNLYDTI